MRLGRAVGCLMVLAVGSLAQADLVYFVRGGEVSLPSTREGQNLRLETPDGPRTVPMSEVLAVVPEPSLEQEWQSIRQVALKDGSDEARFASVWWAFEHGLTGQATEALNQDRTGGTAHGPTRRTVEALDRLSLPCPDPDLGSIRQRLRPGRFQEASSPHLILFHQTDALQARERLDLGERVISTFYLTLAAQGFALKPPAERLVLVLFSDHRDYVGLLRKTEAEPFVGTQGYYHPTLRIILAFEARSLETQRAARRAIENHRSQGTDLDDLTRQTLLLDLKARAIDLGIIAHELIHPLTFVSGLAPRFDDFPTWLHEGLAAQFEVVRSGRWVGLGRVHDLRLPDWRSIRPSPRLAPLLLDVGLGQGYRGELYAESWALVYFLRKTRPAEFRTFLDLLRVPEPDASRRPDRAVISFRAAFGEDLYSLEREWRDYLARLRTPLEMARPSMVRKESHLVQPVADH